MVAVYGTDLVLVGATSDGESAVSWQNVSNAPYDKANPPVLDPENFIQSSHCISTSLGGQTGIGFSIIFDAGSDISALMPSGHVVMAWVYFAVGSDLFTTAAHGHQFIIAANDGAPDANLWDISGKDRAPNPYGGWWNVAVDPLHAPDVVAGVGHGGAYRFFGSIIALTLQIQKGNPHAVDVMRRGRGEIFCTGTGATFTGMAAANDLLNNRWGLFQDTAGGSFLWKGLMSLGQAGLSTTFTASNQTIKIDDTNKTYADFNKIEIRHASTTVLWTNIVISASGTAAPGNFQIVENAAFTMRGGSFNSMGTFAFLSNTNLRGVSFSNCGQINSGGANFNTCSIVGYTGAVNTSAVVHDLNIDTNGIFNNTTFDAGLLATHAIELGQFSPSIVTLSNVTFLSFGIDGANDAAIHVKRAFGSVTINISGGGTTPTIKTDGAVVTVVNAVTISITAINANDGLPVQGARISLEAAPGGALAASSSISSLTHIGINVTANLTSHGMISGATAIIRGATPLAYNGIYTITAVNANQFTYKATSDPGVDATGAPTATAQIMAGLTDVNGLIEDVGFNFIAAQPITGRLRRGTTSALFKTAGITGTIFNTGFSTNIAMIPDE